MQIMDPIEELPTWLALAESSGPPVDAKTPPDDEAQRAAERLGRINVSYEHVWAAVQRAAGHWVPVRCDTVRRALLLASAATQHRTHQHEVWRRGKVVCIKATGVNRSRTNERDATYA